MKHDKMHEPARRAPQGTFSIQTLPSSIGRTSVDASATETPGAFASAFTTVAQTRIMIYTSDGVVVSSTRVVEVPIADPSSYASLTASEASARSSSTAAAAASRTSSSAATATQSAKNDSSNLSTLIPAIVVPIAAVLLCSFLAFWWFMRRKHQKRLEEEPEFIMAKPEKNISRENSHSSSTSSTRELVPLSKLEKESVVSTTEVKRDPGLSQLPPPKYTSTVVGVARPMTPPDKNTNKNMPTATTTAATAPSVAPQRAVPNFSAPRPSTSQRNRPSADYHDANRNRSRSTSNNHPPIIEGRADRGTPDGQRGRGPGSNSFNNRAQPSAGHNSPQYNRNPPQRGPPLTLTGGMNNTNRAGPPKPLNPPTPTGAFNGASPISQYSPIVKDIPSTLNSAISPSAGNNLPYTLPQINTQRLGVDSEERTDSPVDSSILSAENMRIARLANSSRLGFNLNSPTESSFPRGNPASTKATSPLSQSAHSQVTGSASSTTNRVGQPATSPQLPPPISREELSNPQPLFVSAVHPPLSPGASSSIYPAANTPQIGALQSTTSLSHTLQQQPTNVGLEHRASVISRVSNDEYEDIHADDKSDVSSLDEHELYEMAREGPGRGTPTLGLGMGGSIPHFEPASASNIGTALSPTMTASGYGSEIVSPVDGHASSVPETVASGGNKSMRDRDSEGPFVLSRY